MVAPLDLTFWALIVMPRSALEVHGVSTAAHLSRIDTPVSSRCDPSVDFPWSMWAMMLKFRMRSSSMTWSTLPTRLYDPARAGPALRGWLGTIGVAGSLDWLNRRDLRGEHQEPEEAQPAEHEAGRAQQRQCRSELKTRVKAGALVERGEDVDAAGSWLSSDSTRPPQGDHPQEPGRPAQVAPHEEAGRRAVLAGRRPRRLRGRRAGHQDFQQQVVGPSMRPRMSRSAPANSS